MDRITLAVILARAGRAAGAVALVAGLVLSGLRSPAVQASSTLAPPAGDWIQVAELVAADGAAYDCFGSPAAISDDMIVVGAEHHDVDDEENAGAVYVFERSGTTWSQEAQLALRGDPWGIGPVAIWGDTIYVRVLR